MTALPPLPGTIAVCRGCGTRITWHEFSGYSSAPGAWVDDDDHHHHGVGLNRHEPVTSADYRECRHCGRSIYRSDRSTTGWVHYDGWRTCYPYRVDTVAERRDAVEALISYVNPEG